MSVLQITIALCHNFKPTFLSSLPNTMWTEYNYAMDGLQQQCEPNCLHLTYALYVQWKIAQAWIHIRWCSNIFQRIFQSILSLLLMESRWQNEIFDLILYKLKTLSLPAEFCFETRLILIIFRFFLNELCLLSSRTFLFIFLELFAQF